MKEPMKEPGKKGMVRYPLIAGFLMLISIFLIACGSDPTQVSQPGPTEKPAPASVPVSATATPGTQVTAESSFTLIILHNNDGESQLVDSGPGLEDFGGVARFVNVVRREKQTASPDAVITVSSGDNFLAGREVAAGLRSGIFYDSVAMDLIGYDAIALGNHDFDLGPEVLAQFINQA